LHQTREEERSELGEERGVGVKVEVYIGGGLFGL
jgi:hypothetical protein